MAEIDDLRQWLNSPRNFDEGMALLIAHFPAKQRESIQHLRDGVRLFNTIRERFFHLKKTVVQEPPPAVGKPYTGRDIPDKELADAWREMKTDMERWHVELQLLGDKGITDETRQQRAKLAALLLKKQEELDGLSLAIEHLREHGSLPEGFALHKKMKPVKTVKLPKLNDAEKVLLVKNQLMPNRSKYRKKVKAAQEYLHQNPEAADAAKKKLDINKWLGKLREIDQQLNRLTHAA